ncbi:amino acid adenylation domain-containing protein, partial [Paenibacillus oenotherae]
MEISKMYRLTPMQEGMLFHSLYDPDSPYYFEQFHFAVRGPFQADLFENSLNAIIERYEIFRTLFIHEELEEPLQIVLEERPVALQLVDLMHLSIAEQENYIEQFKCNDKLQGFRLSEDELIRVAVLRTEEGCSHLIWSFHHILMDGWCLAIVMNEVMQIYYSLQEGTAPKLGTIYPYSDYIRWLDNQSPDEAENYWKAYLQGYNQASSLPKRIQSRTKFDRKEIVFALDRDVTRKIEQTASLCQVTVNTVFQGAWAVMLSKYNQLEDVVFGSVVSGRPAEITGVETMLGLFLNTIPVRVSCKESMSGADFLKCIQSNALASAKYDYQSLAKIQGDSELKDQLFDHLIVFENYPVQQSSGEVSDSALDIEMVEVFEQTNYDLTVIVDHGQVITVKLIYNAAVYDTYMIRQAQIHFDRVLAHFVDQPMALLKDVRMLSEHDERKLLQSFNETEADYPRDETIPSLFEAQAKRTPERTAARFEGRELTYNELNRRANRLARVLVEKGVATETFVSILADKSLDMVVAILAVVKAGGVYVPIDPAYPDDRIAYMLEDSGARVLLIQSELLERLALDVEHSSPASEQSEKQAGISFPGTILLLDDESSYAECDSDLNQSVHPDQLAYVIYTSGTTGQPKGTMIEHRNVVRLFFNSEPLFGFSEQDVWTVFHSFCFDFSVWEMYGALLHGGTLVIVPSMTAKSPELFLSLLRQERVTILNQTPTYFYQLMQVEAMNRIRDEVPGNDEVRQLAGTDSVEDDPLSLRMVIFGGEALNPALLGGWKATHPAVQLINMYGITETTVHVTYKEISAVEIEQGASNIGLPIPTLQVYVLDQHRRLLPIGVPGEMYVAGAGLARGYLNKPELTAERFVDNPFATGEKLYRSGDLARWLPDGNLEYLGRIDQQVKIRGYRIELGEIEAVLQRHEQVKEAVVIARQDKGADSYLCAYVVGHGEMEAAELRRYVGSQLPSYMVPAFFVELAEVPLTPNGKVDRRGLPEPERSAMGGESYVAPRTELEAKLAEIWQSVLGIAQVGAKDHFFELGGHSLKATMLAARVYKELNVNLPLRSIFEAPRLEELAQRIGEQEESKYASIEQTEERSYYPVSSAQRRMYILNQLEGAQTSYNMPGVYMVEGELDTKRMESALRELIRRHESLRTSFELAEGEPVQRVHAEVPFVLEEQQLETAEAAIEAFMRPFELSEAPLFRARVVKLAEEGKRLFMYDMHHIVSDGVSMQVLVEEFARLYGGEELPALRIQYKDYAVWQQERLSGEELKRQETYWLKRFGGELPVLELPTDDARPAVQRFEGESIGFDLPLEVEARVRQIASQTGATLYMVLLAAYATLLSKYSGQEDIIIGTPVAGRPHADLEQVIGMFVGTLALRNEVKKEATFLEQVAEVKRRTLEAFEHADYPLEELVEKLDLERDMSRNPLFDTMFAMQNMTEAEASYGGGLKMTPYGGGEEAAKFDLTLQASEMEGRLVFQLQYRTSLYRRASMERLAGHFVQLLTEATSKPEERIGELSLLPEEERERLAAFNRTEAPYPKEQTIHSLFEEQVKRTPERTALVYGEERLSYAELNARSNRLARRLREQGVGADELVGIALERSTEMIVAILGVLKAGGAYVPIDPSYPEERIRYTLSDAGVKLVLTQTDLAEKFAGITESLLVLERGLLEEGDGSDLPEAAGAEHLAYVIYTSGSTGLPKGVMIEHESIANALQWRKAEYGLSEKDRVLQLFSYAFDGFLTSCFTPLLSGSEVVFLAEEASKDPAAVKEAVKEYGITHFIVVPALYAAILASAEAGELKTVKRITLAGEAVTAKLVSESRRLTPETELINEYGPTENSVVTSFNRGLEKQESQAIGRPIANVHVYILDRKGCLQPIGVAGELCIAGAGLARGYLNRPELTEEKFVQHPNGERLYRTGDLARWLPDGNLDYLGRIDEQVKIRGYRIELGEIEAVLQRHEQVKEAVVIARQDKGADSYLCAYVVGHGELEAAELRRYVGSQLPSYMVPAFF